MLFFVSAANVKSTDENTLIDLVFTRYVAMPYGHVESDIYNKIIEKQGNLTYFTIDSEGTKRKEGFDIATLLNSTKDHYLKIDESISFLKKNYPSLIKLSAHSLVDLSHLWYSWQKNYNTARIKGKRSEEIKPKDIKAEKKIFSFETYWY